MVDVEDATTTDGGGGATTSGGSVSKKARKDRTPTMVDVGTRSIITSVSAKGVPEEPQKVAAGYSLQLAAILWVFMFIMMSCLLLVLRKNKS